MYRRSRRAVSPIIATILLLAITVVLAAVLSEFRPPLPPQEPTFSYYLSSGAGEPTWGDGSDCKNIKNATTGQTVQSCVTLPSLNILLTSSSVPVVPLDSLTFYFICNGTVYLTAPLTTLEWVPGTPATVGGSAPQLGKCGSYVPPKAAWNRLAYYHQVYPGAANWFSGDTLVLYAHTFTPPNCPNPQMKNGVITQCDDDFHGAPEWCYTVSGACTLMLTYSGPPSPSLALRISLFGLSG